jgi:hypothetical protein
LDGKNLKSVRVRESLKLIQDEYKENVYSRNPKHWNSIEVGDLSYMMGVKKKLQCKPFSYFLEVVAPGENCQASTLSKVS